MVLPMIEYDRGVPVAVVNYLNRSWDLPVGDDVTRAYKAFGQLLGLPFFTVRYDPCQWAYQVKGHNEAALRFLSHQRTWIELTEVQFADFLYRLRGRISPDLRPYGVDFNRAPWDPSLVLGPQAEPWPGQLMSQRRRNFEPVQQVRATWRNPCLDIDLAVVNRDRRVALVVDYKAPEARVSLDSTNMKALSSLRQDDGSSVPAMVVRYGYSVDASGFRNEQTWAFKVHCLNATARSQLSFALGHVGAVNWALASVVADEEWTDLTEAEWVAVLRCIRDL
jgi:hypothetical protein